MVSIFESGLGDKRKDPIPPGSFIEEQIKAYEQKLVDAENRLEGIQAAQHAHGWCGGRIISAK